jgi:N-acetyl-gamma-glutamyl-phosphate reductase common form
MKIKIAIFGGSGYGGSELLRILLFHEHAEIVLVTANEHAGKPVGEVHKNLFGLTQLKFEPTPADLSNLEADVAFFALPHGQAISLVPNLPKNIKIIDLSGDFRIDDAEIFKQFYKLEQSDLQKDFIYGLTEINREQIRTADKIANPGCFATATLLALAPLVKSGLPNGKIIVDAKTGSSGSGAKPAANTHHPQRMNSFYAYKPFTHQHVPEITQCLRSVGNFESEFVFMTHSLPVARGIFASCYAELEKEMTTQELFEIYKDFYYPSKSKIQNPKSKIKEDSFFVRLTNGSPDINWVKTTNFCDLAVHSNGKQIVAFSAIDNLVKGAAGQAVQNMNLMFGLDEKTGLILVGTNP